MSTMLIRSQPLNMVNHDHHSPYQGVYFGNLAGFWFLMNPMKIAKIGILCLSDGLSELKKCPQKAGFFRG